MIAGSALVVGSALGRFALSIAILLSLSLLGFASVPAAWGDRRARIAIPLSLSAGFALAGCGGWVIGALAGTAWILPIVAIAVVGAAFRSGREWLVSLRRVGRELGAIFRHEKLASLMLLLPVVVSIPQLLLPVFDADGIRYHLAHPKLYVLTGKIFFYRWDVTGGFPEAAETIFLTGYRIAGGETAKFIHFSFFLATLAVLVLLVHTGRSTRRVSLLAALLFAATPIVVSPASAAFTDLIAMYHIAAATLVVMRSRRVASSSIAMASAFVTKMVAAPALAGLAIVALARAPRSTRVRTLGWIVLVPTLFFAPFAIRNVMHTGDPFFPMGYGLLHRPIEGVSADSLRYATFFHSQVPGLLGIPWLPQEGVQLDEVAGIHHLVGLFALLLVIRRRELRPLLALIFPYILLGLFYRPPARYSIPMFFALAILESHALVLIAKKFAPLVALLAALAAMVIPLGLSVVYSTPIGGYLSGKLGRDQFLTMTVPGYRAAMVVNQQPPGGTVMALDFPAPYYFNRPWIVEGILNQPPLERWVHEGASAEQLLDHLHTLGVKYLVVTPGFGGGGRYSLAPLAHTRAEAIQVLAFRQRLRPVARVDGIDIYEVP